MAVNRCSKRPGGLDCGLPSRGSAGCRESSRRKSMVLRRSLVAQALLRAFVRCRPTVSLAVFGEAWSTTYQLASTVQACRCWKLLSTQPEQLSACTWMLSLAGFLQALDAKMMGSLNCTPRGGHRTCAVDRGDGSRAASNGACRCLDCVLVRRTSQPPAAQSPCGFQVSLQRV